MMETIDNIRYERWLNDSSIVTAHLGNAIRKQDKNMKVIDDALDLLVETSNKLAEVNGIGSEGLEAIAYDAEQRLVDILWDMKLEAVRRWEVRIAKVPPEFRALICNKPFKPFA